MPRSKQIDASRRNLAETPNADIIDIDMIDAHPFIANPHDTDPFTEFEHSIHDVIMAKQAIHRAKRGRGYWMDFTYTRGDEDIFFRPTMFNFNGFTYAIARAAEEGRIEYLFIKYNEDPKVTTTECCRVNQAMDITMFN